MAYDAARYQQIQSMSVAELVHTMLVEFSPNRKSEDPEIEGTFLQSADYHWAAERLDEIFERLSAW